MNSNGLNSKTNTKRNSLRNLEINRNERESNVSDLRFSQDTETRPLRRQNTSRGVQNATKSNHRGQEECTDTPNKDASASTSEAVKPRFSALTSRSNDNPFMTFDPLSNKKESNGKDDKNKKQADDPGNKAKDEKKFVTMENPILSKKLKREAKRKKKKKNKEAAKKPCCLSWIFFFEFNHLFKIGAKRGLTKQDMAALPPGIRSDVVKKEALKILKDGAARSNQNNIFAMLANMDMDIGTQLAQLPGLGKMIKKKDHDEKKSSKTINDITQIIWLMIQDKIKMAILFKVLENVIIVILTVMLRIYSPAIKKYSTTFRGTAIIDKLKSLETIYLFFFPLFALILAFLRYTFKEHSAKFVCQSGSKTGQTLRALLFQKLRSANFSFLKNADSIIIEKMILFDFNIILGYVGKLPDLISFPVILILSISAMVYFVGWTALGSLVIFLVGWIILVLVTKQLVYQNMK